MKIAFLIPLFCIATLAKAQQLPKSGENSIFKKLEIEEVLPKTNNFSGNALKKEEKFNEQLINSTNIFKNKFYKEQLAKQPVIVYQMPIVDTKNDNSGLRIFEPSPLFKSNMPVGSRYSYW